MDHSWLAKLLFDTWTTKNIAMTVTPTNNRWTCSAYSDTTVKSTPSIKNLPYLEEFRFQVCWRFLELLIVDLYLPFELESARGSRALCSRLR